MICGRWSTDCIALAYRFGQSTARPLTYTRTYTWTCAYIRTRAWFVFLQDVVLHILFKSAVGFCNTLGSSPDSKMASKAAQPYLPPILRPIGQSGHGIDEIAYPPGLMLFLKALAASKETETRIAFAVFHPNTDRSKHALHPLTPSTKYGFESI